MAKYIDADRLLNEARMLSGPMTGDGWDNLGVYALIERQPKADVRENVRGEWVSLFDARTKVKLNVFGNTTDACVCSVCGEMLTASDEYSCRGNFCPNCGADMRGEYDE